ncbi:hypothetical protein B296_00002164 [Ensete ventricosum]|uniref:Uncharacterized protein n=1 Tax=Ensete ventricosum TaxID=4639 RepID=A0A427AEH6_ENSVE|nr:hypothetical protein B296_00002164 [Ensete ventricosum]
MSTHFTISKQGLVRKNPNHHPKPGKFRRNARARTSSCHPQSRCLLLQIKKQARGREVKPQQCRATGLSNLTTSSEQLLGINEPAGEAGVGKRRRRRGEELGIGRGVFDPRLRYRSCGRDGRGDDGIEASRGHAFDCEPYFGHGREGNPNHIPAEEKSEDKKVW